MATEFEILQFLKKNNINIFRIQKLKSDASFRRYLRVYNDNKTFILMDSPQSEKPYEFYSIDLTLRQHGINVPKIYAADLSLGLILMEDFGDNLYDYWLKKESEQVLYHTAIDVLLKVKNIQDCTNIPIYDLQHFINGISIFLDWFMPQLESYCPSDSMREGFIQIWKKLFQKLNNSPKGIMLMDYQSFNLMWLGQRTGLDRCGVLDFQDARIGPLAYDLAALIEDARRERPLPKDTRQQLLEYYLSHIKHDEIPLFLESYHITSVKRLIRCIGIFCRLALRDQKYQYLHFIPMLWELIEEHLNEPYFFDLKVWLDKYVPSVERNVPQRVRKYI